MFNLPECCDFNKSHDRPFENEANIIILALKFSNID